MNGYIIFVCKVT